MKEMFFKLLVLLSFAGGKASGQSPADTSFLSFSAAEKIFLEHNLSLLSARYGIDANRALIRQARLWDNPLLATDQNLYDKQGGFLKHDQNNGQFYVQLTQLIRTAGKRSKAAQLAMDNTILSEQQLDDVLRSLRYTLRNDLLEVNHLLKIKRVYDAEIAEVIKLSAGMDLLLEAGNVSVKDNLRIKALLFSLENELVTVKSQLIPVEGEIRVLLNNNDNRFIRPELDYQFKQLTVFEAPPAEELIVKAVANRPDARMAQTLVSLQTHNVIYQKALAKPDISIGTEFDQHSSYAPDYVGLAIGLPLNIFNHNQGNISSAKFSLQQQKVLADQSVLKIRQDILSAVEKLKFFQHVNDPLQLEFSRKYDNLFFSMLKSYQDRQLNLLDFIDFMDAYKDTKLKLLEQHNGLVKSVEELNYAVGEELFKLN